MNVLDDINSRIDDLARCANAIQRGRCPMSAPVSGQLQPASRATAAKPKKAQPSAATPTAKAKKGIVKQATVLDAIVSRRGATTQELADHFGRKPNSIDYHLALLQGDKQIVQGGDGKWRRVVAA